MRVGGLRPNRRSSVVKAVEAEAARRRLLGVADTGLDLALAVGVAAGQGDEVVVGEHVAVERIEGGVVDISTDLRE